MHPFQQASENIQTNLETTSLQEEQSDFPNLGLNALQLWSLEIQLPTTLKLD